jgi:hypothetical protein
MDFTPRLNHEGFGRELTPGDIKKVAVAEITSPYFVDTVTIRAQKAAFANGDSKKLTKLPGDKGFDVREGEIAFKLRNSPNGGVMTAINGLEEGIAKQYPNNPQLVRDIVVSIITPVGVVREDARTDMTGAKVTLRVGGTCPLGAPNEYNVPGTEQAFIEECSGVVADVPSLIKPIQWGNEQSGRPSNKITLLVRAANKTMTATRALNVISHLIHDPVRFKEALDQNEHVANSWIKLGFRMLDSYMVSHCMALNQDLRRGVNPATGRDAPFIPNFGQYPELGNAASRSESIVAAYAELIGVLPAGRVMASLTPAQRQFWAEHTFALKNVLLPTPHIDSKSYNAAYAFGFTRSGPQNTIESLATNGDTVRRTPIGDLYAKSLVHTREMLESLVECSYEERRMTIGVAMSAPNPTGTGIFNMQIIPNGGMGDIK